jgi:osmoprotectant transport system permease protein
MDVLSAIGEVVAWLIDPAHWSGPDGIPMRLWEHLTLSIAAVVVALLIALPIGLYIGHTRRGEVIAINLVNVARAIPSYAVMVMALPLTLALDPRNGLTTYPILIAMILLAVVPILVNAAAGVRDIDPELVEAARGMGMREGEILRRVELPLALPVIVGGVRTSAVQVVATVTLGAILGYGGLGRYLVDGIARREYDRLWAGVVLVALVSIATELGLAMLERRLTSPGQRVALGGQVGEPART